MVYQPTSLAEKVTLRPVELPDDEAFLQELYCGTRSDLAGIFIDQAQERQMMMIQYLGQKQTYEHEFPDADHYIIEFEGERVGRLLVDRRPDEVFGVDLALLPQSRSGGIGTEVLNRLIAESSERRVPFSFSVAKGNPAIRLYERLGCRTYGETATHFFMRSRGHERVE